MARLSLKLAGYPWDHITPLLTDEVAPEGIDLQYDVHHGLGPVTEPQPSPCERRGLRVRAKPELGSEG
jgi:hypothetical protein